MLLKIEEITDKTTWEDFVRDCEHSSFLHSWNWGEFNARQGFPIHRLGFFENGALRGAALVIVMRARRGRFLFCPHGPLARTGADATAVLEAFTAYATRLAQQERCAFIRVSPIWLRTPEHAILFERLGFRRAPIHMHSELCWILNVSRPEEELLKNMRKTHRYLIRKAKKDGVEITESGETNDVKTFEAVYRETVERHHFVPFSESYLKTEFENFRGDNETLWFFGRFRGELLSAAMIVFHGNSAFYHHGATSAARREVPVSYLMLWRAIQEAKRRGLQYFNFWGIAPEGEKNHPWQGLTLFKTGFGGFKEEYLPAQDLVVRTLPYFKTYFIEKIRKWRRRL